MRSPAGPKEHRAGRHALVVGTVILLTLFVSLAAGVAVASGVAGAIRAAATQLVGTKSKPVGPRTTVHESMVIETGKMDGDPGWPRYTNSSWSVQAGDTVVLRITSYDDGTAPLMGAQMMFDRVEGTLGGIELIDGRATSLVSNDNISHTFTVVGLGLNLPIPVAPTGGSVTVVARFQAKRTGNFVWQCYAPCGSGPNSMGGAMARLGWMEGTVSVTT